MPEKIVFIFDSRALSSREYHEIEAVWHARWHAIGSNSNDILVGDG
ncbi:hypothetical protein [Thalassoglobus sp.]